MFPATGSSSSAGSNSPGIREDLRSGEGLVTKMEEDMLLGVAGVEYGVVDRLRGADRVGRWHLRFRSVAAVTGVKA